VFHFINSLKNKETIGRGKVRTLFSSVIKPNLAVFQMQYQLIIFILQFVALILSEPIRFDRLQLEDSHRWNIFAPLGDCGSADTQQLSKLLNRTGFFNGSLCFHAVILRRISEKATVF